MYTDYSGYCYDYNDENNDGSRDPDQGDGCGSGNGPNIGGSMYWSNGGTFSNTYGGITPGSTIGTYSNNDVFSTGINSGMGEMISRYGTTSQFGSWNSGVYSHGTLTITTTSEYEAGLVHIFDAHQYPGQDGKTLFPEHWNRGDIIKATRHITNSPVRIDIQGPRTVYYGYYQDVYIKVVLQGEKIITGYPIE